MENIVNCEEECRTRRNYSCDKTVFEICCLLMDERRLDPPDNTEQGTDVYITETVNMGFAVIAIMQ
ncbi:hypothetical protein EOD39_12713 [Acipenser ruthenus]|uniref:Uncharacterized protein n=1 Tax=Acipenser ruthenus TaxID=7906 RepID=A0A662YQ34_ACIRT|nr:hypothetical protein EOD39_12713 [Acipenser ruthenus]